MTGLFEAKPWGPDDPRHGTTAGVAQHNRHHEPQCEACSEARRLYQKKIRAERPGVRAAERIGAIARSRALMLLANAHPQEYEQLRRRELRALRREHEQARQTIPESQEATA